MPNFTDASDAQKACTLGAVAGLVFFHCTCTQACCLLVGAEEGNTQSAQRHELGRGEGPWVQPRKRGCWLLLYMFRGPEQPSISGMPPREKQSSMARMFLCQTSPTTFTKNTLGINMITWHCTLSYQDFM